jgi:tetratricopeptide (TPR) repeat protein
MLAEAVAHAPAPADVVTDLALSLPRRSAVLAEARLAATVRVLGSLPSDTAPQTRAEWHDRAGLLQAQLGRHADALRSAQDAVAIRRRLAATDAGYPRSDLAASLIDLGMRLAELGRPAEAVGPQSEAVSIYRELAVQEPTRYRADLAGSLADLGARFCESGRPGEAVPVIKEAIAVYRDLVTIGPGRYRPELARALTGLATAIAALGHDAQAAEARDEAEQIVKEDEGWHSARSA